MPEHSRFTCPADRPVRLARSSTRRARGGGRTSRAWRGLGCDSASDRIDSLCPAQPTVPSSQASISPHSIGKPPASSICRRQTARFRSVPPLLGHLSRLRAGLRAPRSSPSRLRASPSLFATSQRSTTRRISSEGSMLRSVSSRREFLKPPRSSATTVTEVGTARAAGELPEASNKRCGRSREMAAAGGQARPTPPRPTWRPRPTAPGCDARVGGALPRRAESEAGEPGNGGGRIRTSEGRANGFTARPLWPLGNTPRGAQL